MKKVYGLIGHPLGHSFSEKYFTEKFSADGITDCEYKLFDLSIIDEVKNILLKEQSLQGFNITIPYKEAIFPYLSKLDLHAQQIGAVNVVKLEGGKLIGYNSDYIGFLNSLKNFLSNTNDLKALILGTGGASKGIAYALEQIDIPYQYVSRRNKEKVISYDTLKENPDIVSSHQLIINTTPLGTFPNVTECADIPYNLLTKQHYLYDLVYNPSETLFLKNGITQGAKVKNGYEMLVGQAEESWRIWNSNH